MDEIHLKLDLPDGQVVATRAAPGAHGALLRNDPAAYRSWLTETLPAAIDQLYGRAELINPVGDQLKRQAATIDGAYRALGINRTHDLPGVITGLIQASDEVAGERDKLLALVNSLHPLLPVTQRGEPVSPAELVAAITQHISGLAGEADARGRVLDDVKARLGLDLGDLADADIPAAVTRIAGEHDGTNPSGVAITQLLAYLGLPSQTDDDQLYDAIAGEFTKRIHAAGASREQAMAEMLAAITQAAGGDEVPETLEDAVELVREAVLVPRCSAHGTRACGMCSRILSRGLAENGKDCAECLLFESTGMHAHNCANRITTPLPDERALLDLFNFADAQISRVGMEPVDQNQRLLRNSATREATLANVHQIVKDTQLRANHADEVAEQLGQYLADVRAVIGESAEEVPDAETAKAMIAHCAMLDGGELQRSTQDLGAVRVALGQVLANESLFSMGEFADWELARVVRLAILAERWPVGTPVRLFPGSPGELRGSIREVRPYALETQDADLSTPITVVLDSGSRVNVSEDMLARLTTYPKMSGGQPGTFFVAGDSTPAKAFHLPEGGLTDILAKAGASAEADVKVVEAAFEELAGEINRVGEQMASKAAKFFEAFAAERKSKDGGE